LNINNITVENALTYESVIVVNNDFINLNIYNCTFIRNTYNLNQVIHIGVNNATILIYGCIFQDNNAYLTGCIRVQDTSGNITISNCTFTGNKGNFGSGALDIYSANSNPQPVNILIQNSIFDGNFAENQFAAISLRGSFYNSLFTINNCQFANNTNNNGASDILFNYTNGLTSLINNSVFNNFATTGYNLFINYSNVTIENSQHQTTSGLYCNITTQCIMCNVYVTGFYNTLENFFPCNSCINCNTNVCNDFNGGYCNCNIGFEITTNCSTCLSGYFGQNCKQCNCSNGICNDGIYGNGECTSKSQSTSESQSNHKSHSGVSKKLTFLELLFSLPFLLIIFVCT